ncbi:wax ester/triacylglycerol synthase family O-acyltransferase [Acidiferrimicrobium sp. IK]|uniref:WS/DGAT/MGAT family O-acyltransferase n=1 Tax=Acidiferrimicrobium sp. IK TaxID=2871700 RepID=UPI0021CB68E1|nr:wax ester/triacylglycerol synthase family O-acyltransferase [Acidiferrimicrobium sp. IK]MCU4187505.1 wax ester/triacylglycerol synthase family O-acyltransferase [Acidiferrimicrobium sp. IK]
MTHDRLSPLDASFLHIEDDVSHMHIGAVCVFEGPPPAYDEMLATVAGKLHLVPRFRQVVQAVPGDLGRPVWVDYPHFNLEYHIRHTAIPSPGGQEALWRLVARVMSQQLDRSKPLWEHWIVEGLQDDSWALISKTHHCMVDGVSGADMLAVVLDLTPDAPIEPPAEWVPRPRPSSLQLAAEAVVSTMTSPFEQLRVLRSVTRVPRRAAADTAQVMRSLWAAAGVVGRSTPHTSLNGPLGPHRRWMTVDSTVADVKAIRQSLGGTFNDVVLAAITRGFRDLLLSRGESVERSIRTMVPVSVRARNDRGTAIGDGTYDNRVSAIFAELPVGMDDPRQRLAAIAVQMEGLKESRHAMAGERLTELTGFAPPALLAAAGRIGTRLPQRTVNTLTTNVPGPQLPLYARGRKMIRAYPYAPLGAQLRTSVAIFSYDGNVTFGISADFDANPDLEVLAGGIAAGIDELLTAAGHTPVLDLTRTDRSRTDRTPAAAEMAAAGRPRLRAVRGD